MRWVWRKPERQSRDIHKKCPRCQSPGLKDRPCPEQEMIQKVFPRNSSSGSATETRSRKRTKMFPQVLTDSEGQADGGKARDAWDSGGCDQRECHGKAAENQKKQENVAGNA